MKAPSVSNPIQLPETVSQEQLEAVTEVGLLVAFADGKVTDAERARIAKAAAGLSADTGFQQAIVERSKMSRPEGLSDHAWRERRLKELRVTLPTQMLRMAAFSLAVEVAHVDQGIGLREGTMLVLVAEILEIDADTALSKIRDPKN